MITFTVVLFVMLQIHSLFANQYAVWKSTIKRDHDFYVKSTFFTKELTKELISRNIEKWTILREI